MDKASNIPNCFNDEIISHVVQSTKNDCHCTTPVWRIQTNREHSEGVASLASKFTSGFGMASWGEMLGMLHDRGKESNGFQSYIRRATGIDPSASSSTPKNHSFIGAVLAHRLPLDQLYWLSNAIAGHHRGMYDVSELEMILQSPIPENVSQELPEISLSLPSFRPKPADASHIARMLFSCLVDADWLDTERFMQPEKWSKRGLFDDMNELNLRLANYLDKLKELPHSPINTIRNNIQKQCEETAYLEPGFFELTVPTGGGKTIASVLWAIKHALKYKKERIIIAIPFTSIIVQTAATLRKIFGEENVIEHHSAVNETKDDEKWMLATENWDAPIIVTTNVQLFESMFSNRPSACRKLHSLVNSVVVLDEAQTLPHTFLLPIVEAMKTYTRIFGTSFLFCTASQPILDGQRQGSNGAILQGIERSQIRSVIRPDMNLHEQLRRVKITFLPELLSCSTLSYSLKKHRRVLCVVNSRRHALEMYRELTKDTTDTVIHLSRSMCSAHILEKINEIKHILQEPDRSIIVISTQLIEAGVDIDFPVVYRQLCGLDSILQAAGRCNREAKHKQGQTVVFSFCEDKPRGFIGFASDTMKDMISLYPDSDWFAPETMRRYYEKLYHRTPYFDKERIMEMIGNPKNCRFEEVSKKFRLIEEAGTNIIVNFGESEKLVEKLKFSGPSRSLSRQLGRYSVNVPDWIFKEMQRDGLIEEPSPGFYHIPYGGQYDASVGLLTTNEFDGQTFII